MVNNGSTLDAYRCRFTCGHERSLLSWRLLYEGEPLWCPRCDRDRAVSQVDPVAIDSLVGQPATA